MRTFKGFIIKCVLFLVPFFVLAGFYFYDDPFKVLRDYKKYDNDPIFLNEDYIGWKTGKNTSTGVRLYACTGRLNDWLPYTGK